ncbi:MAG: hypothetical protein PHT59_07015, partial [Candidatus Omnitrophica bacterium]|nr:hypothetical protein [Candidatus Omnitrophota bacterium]
MAGAFLLLSSGTAAGYPLCAPGQACDSVGQTCTYYLPTGTNCPNTLVCTGYNRTETVSVPENQDCFCMQKLSINKVDDLSLVGGNATAYFTLRVRKDNLVTYTSQTNTVTDLFFNSGDTAACRGCQYNNPSCPSGQFCDAETNVCLNNGEGCQWYEERHNGGCRLKPGYCYDDGYDGRYGHNDGCSWNEICDNHQCRDHYHDYYYHGGVYIYPSGYYDGGYYNNGNSYYCSGTGGTTYCKQTFGDSYYCDQYVNYCTYESGTYYSPSYPTQPLGGYQCSDDEYVCGWPCKAYYSIDATCGQLMKNKCSNFGLSYMNPYDSGPTCVSCHQTSAYCTLSSAVGSYGEQTYQISQVNDVDYYGNPTSITSNFCQNDPPVSCSIYLSGPGLARTFIGTRDFDTLPNNDYQGVVAIASGNFTQAGVYSMDVSCGIDQPSGATACATGCDQASATVNFHVDTCNTAVSVQTDKAQYASGDMMTLSGTV